MKGQTAGQTKEELFKMAMDSANRVCELIEQDPEITEVLSPKDVAVVLKKEHKTVDILNKNAARPGLSFKYLKLLRAARKVYLIKYNSELEMLNKRIQFAEAAGETEEEDDCQECKTCEHLYECMQKSRDLLKHIEECPEEAEAEKEIADLVRAWMQDPTRAKHREGEEKIKERMSEIKNEGRALFKDIEEIIKSAVEKKTGGNVEVGLHFATVNEAGDIEEIDLEDEEGGEEEKREPEEQEEDCHKCKSYDICSVMVGNLIKLSEEIKDKYNPPSAQEAIEAFRAWQQDPSEAGKRAAGKLLFKAISELPEEAQEEYNDRGEQIERDAIIERLEARQAREAQCEEITGQARDN